MFSLMRRTVTATAAMQGPRVRFGDLRHPQLFDSLKSEITKPPGLGPPFRYMKHARRSHLTLGSILK